jgi:hypothetical protein
MKRILASLFCIASAACAQAQSLVPPERLETVKHAFESLPKHKSLDCKITPFKPALGFDLEFDSRFITEFPLAEFEGKQTDLNAYLQITPLGGAPVFLSEWYRIRGVPPFVTAKVVPRVFAWGGFSVGEGAYRVELLVVDEHSRSCWKGWAINAAGGHFQANMKPALPPGTVSAMSLAHDMSGRIST